MAGGFLPSEIAGGNEADSADTGVAGKGSGDRGIATGGNGARLPHRTRNPAWRLRGVRPPTGAASAFADPDHTQSPRKDDDMDEFTDNNLTTADYVVVGTGSAGSIVAERLSADPP